MRPFQIIIDILMLCIVLVVWFILYSQSGNHPSAIICKSSIVYENLIAHTHKTRYNSSTLRSGRERTSIRDLCRKCRRTVLSGAYNFLINNKPINLHAGGLKARFLVAGYSSEIIQLTATRINWLSHGRLITCVAGGDFSKKEKICCL